LGTKMTGISTVLQTYMYGKATCTWVQRPVDEWSLSKLKPDNIKWFADVTDTQLRLESVSDILKSF